LERLLTAFSDVILSLAREFFCVFCVFRGFFIFSVLLILLPREISFQAGEYAPSLPIEALLPL